MPVQRACVIGEGRPALEIAALFANAKILCLFCDLSDGTRASGMLQALSSNSSVLLDAPSRMRYFLPAGMKTHKEHLRGADLVIEATENSNQELLDHLVETLRPESLLGSTDAFCEAEPSSKANFFKANFSRPVSVRSAVEILSAGENTKQQEMFLAELFACQLGRMPLMVKKSPGLLISRLETAYTVEALAMVERGEVSLPELELVLPFVLGLPTPGLLRVADLYDLRNIQRNTARFAEAFPDEDWQLPDFVNKMIQADRTGDDAGGGFYREGPGGAEMITLNNEYRGISPPDNPLWARLNGIPDLKERLRHIMSSGDESTFFLKTFLRNIVERSMAALPDTCASVEILDAAVREGLGFKLGPFELFDECFDKEDRKELNRYPWMKTWFAGGREKFYSFDRARAEMTCAGDDGTPRTRRLDGVTLGQLEKISKPVEQNEDARLWSLPQGCFLLEMRKTFLGQGFLEQLHKTIDRVASQGTGLMIGSGLDEMFGATDLAMIASYIRDKKWKDLEKFLRYRQRLNQALRNAPFPVVFVPHGVCASAALEMALACDKLHSHASTRFLFDTMSVGLPPAGGSLPELARRAAEAGGDEGPIAVLPKLFAAMIRAQSVDNLESAKKLLLCREQDTLSRSRLRRFNEAHQEIIRMLHLGYTPPPPGALVPVAGEEGAALLEKMVLDARAAGELAPFDAQTAGALAKVLCGGPVSAGVPVNEAWMLDIEVEAWLTLASREECIHRIERRIRGRMS